MGKHDSAPTHSWVVSSQVNRWLALLFMVVVIVSFIAIWTVRYSINRDCQDVYTRDLNVFGYWVHIRAGSTKPECPQA